MRLNPPWLNGIRWERLTPRDALWLLRFLLRSMWESAFGVRPFLTLPSAPFSELLPKRVPKRIWMFWSQGWEEAPELVRLCRESWQRRNPGWELIALDAEAAEALTGAGAVLAGKNHSIQALSNMVRLSLLARHGGVWADATTFCVKPLDDWLPLLMQSGFFAFSRPGPERLLDTWFLAAEPENPLMEAWLCDYQRFWRAMTSSHRYFAAHFIFTDLCRRRRGPARTWATTPQVSAGLCDSVAAGWDRADLAARFHVLKELGAPLFKLNWHKPLPQLARDILRDDLAAISP